MRWYARHFGEDPHPWGLAGLLHDFDYEEHPDEHPLWGLEKLRALGVEPEVCEAIAAHYPAKTGVEPISAMARHLYACDEMTGFVFAVTYVRPSRRIEEVEVKSVTKKMKTPSFAAAIPRSDLLLGAELIQLPIEDHIGNVLQALAGQAEALGLAGT